MGKDDQELSSFRIADMRRPQVRSSRRKEADPEPESSPSVGFPGIERRLETGDIETIAEELRKTYEQLEELLGSGDMKSKAGAKRAMAAYERTADLFEYLFETKSAMSG